MHHVLNNSTSSVYYQLKLPTLKLVLFLLLLFTLRRPHILHFRLDLLLIILHQLVDKLNLDDILIFVFPDLSRFHIGVFFICFFEIVYIVDLLVYENFVINILVFLYFTVSLFFVVLVVHEDVIQFVDFFGFFLDE